MIKKIANTFCLILLFLLPATTFAGELTIRPFLIDETIEPRDVLTRDIVLTNTYDTRKLTVYASVNEISVDEEGEIKEFRSPVMTDRTNTVTSWVELKRGRINIDPLSSTTVPLTVRPHPQAEPGIYHVFLAFVPTKKAHLAEEAALAGNADGVILQITISDTRDESLRLSRFSVDRFVFGDGQSAQVELQNLGDLPAAPSGEIIFYDSSGKEVGATQISTDGKSIAPGEKITIETALPMENTIGRFKANVSLQYGKTQSASLFDSTTFYLMPTHLLLMLLGGLLFFGVLLAFLLQRTFSGRHIQDDDDEVALYVKDGHNGEALEHDIDLSNKK